MMYRTAIRHRLDVTTKRAPSSVLERFHFAALPWRPLLLAACLVLGIAYVTLVNQTAVNGFGLKSLEDRVDELSEQNKRLEIEATQLRSMETLAQVGASLDLQPVVGASYLKPAGAVAAR